MDPQEEKAINYERCIRIISIGAGASSLCFAYKLQRSFYNFSLTIYEKNRSVAGTWHENTYPGCACDVPAHNYTYSFEPKHDWSSVYAGSSEIKQYFEDFADKHGLRRYIRMQSMVTRAEWKESEGIWQLKIEDLVTGHKYEDHCHILINGSGYLNNWAWPSIKGKSEYGGELIHSAAWPENINLEGRSVALIGNGSSGVQILPAIQPLASQVTVFQRSPNWILGTVGESQYQYSTEEKEAFRRDPESHLRLRKANETTVNSIFSVYLANTPLQIQSQAAIAHTMRAALQTPELEEKLIPKFGVGCRRLTPGSGYLESLVQSNVRIVFSGVAALSSKGCISEEGKHYSADVVVCATGFDMTFVPRFPIIGSKGVNLQDAWSDKPSSLLGIATHSFPNYFMFLGPHSPVNNGPTMAAIEAQADHILRLISRYQTENIHSISVDPDSERDFMAHVGSFMKGSVWADKCRSGSKNHTVAGRVPTLWPGSTLHYLEALRDVRADYWKFKYRGNRFSWLGNGISRAEFDPTCDLAFYIRNQDDSEYLGLRKRREALTRTNSQPARELHRTHRPQVINL